jgi:hypothetical protein
VYAREGFHAMNIVMSRPPRSRDQVYTFSDPAHHEKLHMNGKPVGRIELRLTPAFKLRRLHVDGESLTRRARDWYSLEVINEVVDVPLAGGLAVGSELTGAKDVLLQVGR